MRHGMRFFVLWAGVIFLSSRLAQADSAVSDLKAHPSEVPSTHLTRRQIAETLQLTDLQEKQIRKTRDAYRVDIARVDSQIKIEKVELENELDKPVPDQSKIDFFTRAIGLLYGKRLNIRVKASLELEKKILTPQQSDELKVLQSKQSSAPEEIL